MKRLYKSRKQKMLGGVCGGIAEYFDIDPVLIRIVFVLLTLMHGGGIIAYIIGLIIIPEAPASESSANPAASASNVSAPGYSGVEGSNAARPSQAETSGAPKSAQLIVGIILSVIGLVFLLDRIPFFNRLWDMFFYNFFDVVMPVILIVIGAMLIMRGANKRNHES